MPRPSHNSKVDDALSGPASRASQLDSTADTSSVMPGGRPEGHSGGTRARTSFSGAPPCPAADLFPDMDHLRNDNEPPVCFYTSRPPSAGSVRSNCSGKTLGGTSLQLGRGPYWIQYSQSRYYPSSAFEHMPHRDGDGPVTRDPQPIASVSGGGASSGWDDWTGGSGGSFQGSPANRQRRRERRGRNGRNAGLSPEPEPHTADATSLWGDLALEQYESASDTGRSGTNGGTGVCDRISRGFSRVTAPLRRGGARTRDTRRGF
ncbi:hypothetical protein L204_105072 [Cryptococcus depauperatus]|nr:hypothetical protein L204_03721 [Cryptococcus depauperatus CBS 7855]